MKERLALPLFFASITTMSSIARAEIAPLAVFARLRPAKQGIPTALSVVVPEGDDAGAKPRVVRLKGASTAFSSSSAGREHEFTFTRAFAETESQEAVYGEALKPLVTSFVEEGISVTAMAYGQVSRRRAERWREEKTLTCVPSRFISLLFCCLDCPFP